MSRNNQLCGAFAAAKTAALLLVIGALLCVMPSRSFAQNSLTFSQFSVETQVDLGDVTFSFHVKPSGKSAAVGAQMYLHRTGASDWDFVQATTQPGGGSPKVFSLYHSLDNVMTFEVALPVGSYDSFRLLLFNSSDGQQIDFGKLVYDTAKAPVSQQIPLKFKVLTAQGRVTGPQLIYADLPDAEPDDSGTYTVTIPAKIRMPKDYDVVGGYFWAMAKGPAGFDQVQVQADSAVPGGDALDSYVEAPVVFEIKNVKPGLQNIQFGIFKSTWGDALQWSYPGLDFEVGGDSWEVKATQMPPRLRYMAGRFVSADSSQPVALYQDDPKALNVVKFVRGGNFGNAIGWTLTPTLSSPGFFALLGDIGCRFVRIVFNPDRYLNEPLYQHAVDQVVENIWQAGEYPIIAPQDLPKGDTMQERIDRGQAVCRDMAEFYKGKSVWIETVNEPHELDTWAQWKPITERYVKTIRGVDPDAFVIVPFEGWSKDGRGAAADPITDVRVDLYDGHAYVPPAEVASRFGSAAKAGLPVLIGEYGGNADYMQAMDHQFAAMFPPPVAVAPWAFTVEGQDNLPLVKSANGAAIAYTPAGEVVAHKFDLWLQGKAE